MEDKMTDSMEEDDFMDYFFSGLRNRENMAEDEKNDSLEDDKMINSNDELSGPINERIDDYMESLRRFLQNFQNYQHEHPERRISTITLPGGYLPTIYEASLIKVIWNSFTNCCFWPDSGEEVFKDSLSDENPRLMMHFYFDYSNELDFKVAERFKNSSVYKNFVHTTTYYRNAPDASCDHYFIDCGDDLENMLTICRQILIDVFYDVVSAADFSVLYIRKNKSQVGEMEKNAAKEDVSKGLVMVIDAESLKDNCNMPQQSPYEDDLMKAFQESLGITFDPREYSSDDTDCESDTGTNPQNEK